MILPEEGNGSKMNQRRQNRTS